MLQQLLPIYIKVFFLSLHVFHSKNPHWYFTSPVSQQLIFITLLISHPQCLCVLILFPWFTESVDARQRSYDLGIQIGYQRRNKDVLAWVKKRRRTIRREDLISFLCGKAPPPRTSRAAPKLTVMSPNRASSTDTVSSVEADLQPFREAIALHGKYYKPYEWWSQCTYPRAASNVCVFVV